MKTNQKILRVNKTKCNALIEKGKREENSNIQKNEKENEMGIYNKVTKKTGKQDPTYV